MQRRTLVCISRLLPLDRYQAVSRSRFREASEPFGDLRNGTAAHLAAEAVANLCPKAIDLRLYEDSGGSWPYFLSPGDHA